MRKRREEIGAVRVRVESERTQVPLDLETVTDEVDVQRLEINAVVETRRDPWVDGDALVVPVYEEVLARQLVLREEIRLVRRRSSSRERRAVSLRREHAVVERRREDGTWQRIEPRTPSQDSKRREPRGPSSQE